jgi:hypothetical protein
MHRRSPILGTFPDAVFETAYLSCSRFRVLLDQHQTMSSGLATSRTADILGIGNRKGRIVPGYDADVVLLNGDPVADISQAGRVYGVLSKGQLLLSNKLLD